MAGYVRQSAALIVAGQTIRAAHHNAEYNALQTAFSTGSGHKHDGTAGEGAYVPLIREGDTYIEVDDTRTGLARFVVDGVTQAQLITPSVPTNNNELVTKTYVDGVAFNTSLPSQTGNAGRFVTTNGTTASWALPFADQTGNSGRFLTTNGTATSWALPIADQTGNSGRFLTTNGAVTSWALPLPDQAGNSGRYLTTNGSAASWANVFGGSGSLTTATTLTSSSSRVQSVAMTTDAQSVTLPSATTLLTGGPQFILTNTGSRTFGVRDTAGTLLAAVPAGGVAECYLRDNTTPAGTWSVSGRDLQPALTICDATLASTLTQTVEVAVRLTDTLSLHFARNASGHPFVFAVDHSTAPATVGTAVLINATSGSIISAFRISNTKAFIVCSWNSPAPLYNITVSGTTCTVSSGASSGLWVNATFTGAPLIAQCGANIDQFVVLYASGTTIGAQACDASGTNPTVGTQVNISALGSSDVGVSGIYRVSDTTALAIYTDNSGTAGTPFSIRAVVLSLSGTTVTVNTPAGLNDVTTQGSMALANCQLSATSYIVGFLDATNSDRSAVHIGVSGTTVTFGTKFAVEVGTFGDNNTFMDGNSNRFQPLLYPLSATTALYTYGDNGAADRHVVLTNSGGTLTAGTILYGLCNFAAGGNFPQASDGFLAYSAVTSENSFSAITISGTSLSVTGTFIRADVMPQATAAAIFGLSGGVRGMQQGSVGLNSYAYWNLFRFRANAAPQFLGSVALNDRARNTANTPVEVAANKVAITGPSMTGPNASDTYVKLSILEFAA